MKKYVLTDQEGYTVEREQLIPGKYIHSAKDSGKDIVAHLIATAHDSPVLAALTGAGQLGPGAKMFMLQTWSVAPGSPDSKAYTTIKETEKPEINMEKRLAFAIAVIREIFRSDFYAKWAEKWLSGEDRSDEALQALKKGLDKEIKDIKALEKFAHTHAAAGSEAQIKEQTDLVERAIHIANAAELSHDFQTNGEQIEMETSMALTDIDRHLKMETVANIADEIIGVNEAA